MNLNKKNLWKPTEPNKVKRLYWTAAGAAVLCLCCATPAMAAGSDPLDIVNNLSDFIFSIIKALGVIILGWGIVVSVGSSRPRFVGSNEPLFVEKPEANR